MEKFESYKEIRRELDRLGLVYMTTQCIDVDIQNIGSNDFNTVDEVLSFYRYATREYIEKVYVEYYGLEGIID